MSETTTQTGKKTLDPAVALVAYICGALGLVVILGIAFWLVRRRRWKKARKYIKQQSARSISMGPDISDVKPPTAPWKWKDVKAGIKARRRGERLPEEESEEEDVVDNGRPTSAGIATISNGESAIDTDNIHGVSRPQSAITSLGPSHKKMHGDRPKHQIHSIKHERLRKRLDAKHEKQERKARQKEIKHILKNMLEGQSLPGDEFPEDTRQPGPSTSGARAATASTSAARTVTHVGPLRRESLSAIPNTHYLIQRAQQASAFPKKTPQKQLSVPKGLSSFDEVNETRGGVKTPRRVQSEVIVHTVADRNDSDSDIESVGSNDAKTTEL